MRGRVMLLDRGGGLQPTAATGGSTAPEDLASLAEAESSFRRALEMDSVFVPALSGLAGALLIRGVEAGEEGRVQVEAAQEFAARALELDPGSEEAAELIQGIRSAMAELEGVEMDSALAFAMPATSLGMEIQRSLAETRVRERGDEAHRVRGVLRLIAAGRVDLAVKTGEALIEEGIEDPLLFEAVEQGHRISGSLSGVPGVVGRRYDTATAREVRSRIEQEGLPGYWSWKSGRIEADLAAGRRTSATVTATARMAAGHVDAALAGLHEALAERDPLLALVRHDATWDPVRATEAFQETIRAGRAGVPGAPRRPPGG